VKRIIAVGAGKGGVGKSTVAAILAGALAREGRKVGLLDGDIYGPSMPTMMGLHDQQPSSDGKQLLPFEAHGLKIMSIGKLVDPDHALVWRGPRAHRAFTQLVTDTKWGTLDDLIIDLPPGTGDVPLTLAQLLPLTGAVIVCTPQVVAQDDARRAARMFEELGVPVLGVVENMSSFIAPDGTEYDLFGSGGGQNLAESLGLPFLGSIPIHPELRINADAGTPEKNWSINELVSDAFATLAANVQRHADAAQQSTTRPTLDIN
jgi:ATP-binding protein involved in chromosome partitioning